ncbi:MAG: hypothetical protein ACYS76_03955 [Planctomycetota bacterium]|jgi:hypothetical protein
MSVKEKAKHIAAELRGHVPFTLFGALLGIFFMLVFRRASGMSSRSLFIVFHPAHVVLSAMVTASMFKLHAAKKSLLLVLVVGYFGSVGIATLSDIVIPHIGTQVLGLHLPAHLELYHEEAGSESTEHDHDEHLLAQEDEPRGHHLHLGFVEEWYLVNPAALLGVLIAFFLPRTKFPHAGHVLLSTWASSSYLLMNMQSELTVAAAAGIFATLFVAIWVPCCISDIVFPLLFVKSDLELAAVCPHHGPHSHPHIQAQSELEQ